MWTYSQRTGQLHHNGNYVATGYSGYGPSKNKPPDESLPSVGPIPRGFWLIADTLDSPHTGPHTIHLFWDHGPDNFERSHFLIHGDAKAHPGQASHGCIILDPFTRGRLTETPDRTLQVI
jgi:hypothetical protein